MTIAMKCLRQSKRMKREQTGLASVAQVANLLYRRLLIGNLWTSGRTRNYMTMIAPVLLCLLIGFSPRAHAADALTEALQKGLFEEEANQNLEAAIKAYQDVLGRAEEQRRIAATALFRLAECYRKQGKTNEASAEYRRLVRDYSEQTTLVNLSRQNLVGLGVNTTAGLASPTQNTDSLTTDEEQQEILRIRALIKNSPDLINARNRTIWGNTKGTVLHEAAYKGHLLVAEYLLSNGATVDALDTSNATPLYHAAGNGHKRMVELLLAKGAQPSPARGGQPLHTAVERGFKGVVEVLLAHKADVNAGYMTALHVAIKEKNLPIAELLLTNGASLNALYAHSWNQGPAALHSLATPDGTPLHFAIQIGNPTIARLLTAKGADVNLRTFHGGLTPLHYVSNPMLSRENSVEMIEMLLGAGAKIDALGADGGQLPGWTPLHIAVYHKLPHIVQLLLEKGADPNVPLTAQAGNERTALNMAVGSGATEIVELLLKHKADVNARDTSGNTPLLRAMSEANLPIAEVLLAHKADVTAIDSEGNTVLARAVHADNRAMARLLLSKGANANDTNSYGFPLLHVALGAQPPGTLGSQAFATRLATASRGQVFAPGGPPQTVGVGGLAPGTAPAAKKPDKTMLQVLLENKADPNQFDKVRDKESETALHFAARSGNQSAVESLIEYKADVNARTDSGITPLHWAAQNNREEMVDLLLAHKANANAGNAKSETPLHWTIERGETNIIAKLVKSGADVNACTSSGETPLRGIMRVRNMNMAKEFAAVEFLLKLGASVVKKCDGHSSPFESALRSRNPNLLQLLRKYHPTKLASISLDGAFKEQVWFWEADKPTTLSQAVAAVGLLDKADPTRITLWRYSSAAGVKKSEVYNLDLIRQRGGAHDVQLQDGDELVVPLATATQ
jgi:ankyrin repeat protein